MDCDAVKVLHAGKYGHISSIFPAYSSCVVPLFSTLKYNFIMSTKIEVTRFFSSALFITLTDTFQTQESGSSFTLFHMSVCKTMVWVITMPCTPGERVFTPMERKGMQGPRPNQMRAVVSIFFESSRSVMYKLAIEQDWQVLRAALYLYHNCKEDPHVGYIFNSLFKERQCSTVYLNKRN